jgi:uncharacterized membrane protein
MQVAQCACGWIVTRFSGIILPRTDNIRRKERAHLEGVDDPMQLASLSMSTDSTDAKAVTGVLVAVASRVRGRGRVRLSPRKRESSPLWADFLG